MPPKSRLLSFAAVLIVALVCASSAVAKPHSSHPRHVSGVVVAINAKRHVLKLRVTHGAKHHAAASARAAAAGSAPTIVVSFGDATVSGPNGAVAVGDDVTVTSNTIVGSTTVASAINVIGQPNGGDAGKGAAVPGTVTAVDAAGGTLTLALGSGDSQSGDTQDSQSGDTQDSQSGDTQDSQSGDTQDSQSDGTQDSQSSGTQSPQSHDSQASVTSVNVTVSASTILAVGDTNGDGHITVADISVGDHIVVFTDDATADPIVAIGILDASQPGRDRHAGDPSWSTGSGDGGGGSAPSYQNVNGTVAALLPPDGIQVTVAGDGPLAGQTVTVDVTSSTHYKGVSGFGAIAVGDQVRVYSLSLSSSPIVAVYLGDGPNGPSSDSSPPSSDRPAPAASTATRFGGTVTDVRGDGLTVTVTSGGPLSGQSVIVAVPQSAALVGVTSLSDVNVGDVVEIFTDNAGGSPVVAAKVSDDTTPSS